MIFGCAASSLPRFPTFCAHLPPVPGRRHLAPRGRRAGHSRPRQTSHDGRFALRLGSLSALETSFLDALLPSTGLLKVVDDASAATGGPSATEQSAVKLSGNSSRRCSGWRLMPFSCGTPVRHQPAGQGSCFDPPSYPAIADAADPTS